MPLPVYSIAKLTNATTGATDTSATAVFVDLTGPIPIRTPVVQQLTHPGTPDYALRQQGIQAPEFRLESLEYVASVPDAAARLAAYHQDLKIGNLLGVRIVQNSLDDWPFDVLDVQFSRQPQAGVKVATARPVPSGLLVELRLTWRLRGRGRP